jgi:pseudaminic acid cytidylyltransferase
MVNLGGGDAGPLKGSSAICIIPARGGSKRIPRKNVRLFNGKPIISYPISIALEAELFSHVVVSTEDYEISKIAEQYGAQVPFIRPKNLADDYTATRPVIQHAITQLDEQGVRPEYVCVLYPATPLLSVADIRRGFRQLKLEGTDFVFSASYYRHPIQRALRHSNYGGVEMIEPRYLEARTQDLQEAFHDVGQFYWGKTQAFWTGKTVFTGLSSPFFLSQWQSVDIDSEEDWSTAEILHKLLGEVNR